MRANTQPSAQPRSIAPSSPPSSTSWNVRELEQILINKTFGPQDPVLRIDVTDIRDRLARFRDAKTDNEPPAKQARTSLINATCALTIWGAGSASQETIVEQARKCQIHGKAMASGERGASIVMDQPFVVRLDQLQLRPINPSRPLGEPQFAMQIVVMAANMSDTWPPVEMKTPAPKTAPYTEGSSLVRLPVLVAKWHKLPRCPESQQESLLDLIASQDGQKYKPKLGLKIDASWCAPSTPLELANAEKRSSLHSPLRSSPGAALPDVPLVIEWKFEGLVEFIPRQEFPGYYCPLCAGKNFREAMEFWVHLINNHTLFDFRFSMEFMAESSQASAKGLIKVKLSDNYGGRAASTVPDHREIDWVKPTTPLDLEAYLRGDETWLGKNSKRQASLYVTNPAMDSPRSKFHEQVRHEIPLSAISRPAEKIPDMASPKKRGFRVPRAPHGIQFYRFKSKRPLQEGELVSESDDEIDEEWMLQKHADTIDSFTDTTRDEKEFIQRFDRHMLKEDVASDLHSGEALVRFCRRNRKWLQQKSMKIEFHKKAATLKMQGCIGSNVMWACMNIINEIPPDANSNRMDIDVPSSPESQCRTRRRDNSEGTISPSETGHIYGRCAVCKAGSYDPSKAIRCSNPLCPKPDYHLTCLGLSSRVQNWGCPRCKGTTPPREMLDDGPQPSPIHDSVDGLPIRNFGNGPPASSTRRKLNLNSRNSGARSPSPKGERAANPIIIGENDPVSDASSSLDEGERENDDEYWPEVVSAFGDEEDEEEDEEDEEADAEGDEE